MLLQYDSMRKEFVNLFVLFSMLLVLSNFGMGGELIVKISSENSGKTEFPEFDLLKCDNSACVNCVQFLEKEYKVKVIGDKIILKNLSEGYYLFIPRVPAESFIYFDKKHTRCLFRKKKNQL